MTASTLLLRFYLYPRLFLNASGSPYHTPAAGVPSIQAALTPPPPASAALSALWIWPRAHTPQLPLLPPQRRQHLRLPQWCAVQYLYLP